MSGDLDNLNRTGKNIESRTPYSLSQPYRVPEHMTTTTFQIEGYRIVRTLGVVRGITVRSRSVFGTIGGALHTIVGGNITAFTRLCEMARAEAFDILIQHAGEIGANAIVGVRYDATEIMKGVSEVLAYGTAVVVEPIETGRE